MRSWRLFIWDEGKGKRKEGRGKGEGVWSAFDVLGESLKEGDFDPLDGEGGETFDLGLRYGVVPLSPGLVPLQL